MPDQRNHAARARRARPIALSPWGRLRLPPAILQGFAGQGARSFRIAEDVRGFARTLPHRRPAMSTATRRNAGGSDDAAPPACAVRNATSFTEVSPASAMASSASSSRSFSLLPEQSMQACKVMPRVQRQHGVLVVDDLHHDVGEPEGRCRHPVRAVEHDERRSAIHGRQDRRVPRHAVGREPPRQGLAALHVVLLVQRQIGRLHDSEIRHFRRALACVHRPSPGARVPVCGSIPRIRSRIRSAAARLTLPKPRTSAGRAARRIAAAWVLASR